MKFIVIFQILIQIQCYITFDKGQNSQFNYNTGFICTDDNTKITTVSFSGTFENPPQLLIIPYYFIAPNNHNQAFKIDIMFVTTEQFQLLISCQLGGIMIFQFTWYAINDNRIRILQQPMESNCVDQSIYTHSHNLQQATQAMVILHSWGQVRYPMNFYLEIYELTSSTVKIKLHNSNSNLQKIGYQIVLGTSEAFQKSELIETPGGMNTLLTKSIKKLNYGMLSLPLAGFYWDVNEHIRIRISQQQILPNIQY